MRKRPELMEVLGAFGEALALAALIALFGAGVAMLLVTTAMS